MNILAFSAIRYPGFFGEAVRLPNLGKVLTKKGHEFHLVTCNVQYSRQKIFRDEKGIIVYRIPIPPAIKSIIQLHRYAYPFRDVAGVYVASRTLSLLRSRGVDVDVVYGYMPGPWGSVPASLFKGVRSVPYLLDCADLFKPYPIPTLYRSVKSADFALAISQPVKEHLKRYYQMRDEKIAILPNGVDMELFNPNAKKNEEMQKHPVDHLIIYTGRIYTLEVLVKAAPLIVKEHKSTAFLIVGNHGREFWMREVAKRGVEKHFIFRGPVPQREIPGYIAASDIGINTFTGHPYLAAAHPLKVLEYMACGKPVVVPDLPGVRQTVKHGVHGFLYEAENHVQFAEYINILLSDSGLRRRMGETCWRTIRDNYSWQALGSKLEGILLGLVERRR